MSIRRFLVPVVGVLVVAAGCEPPPQPGQGPGALAPDIVGKTLDGKDVKLSDYRGKVVLVVFWGTWCPVCRERQPHDIQMVTQTYRDRPFAILGIAQDEPETLARFYQSHRLPWPDIVDGNRRVAREWDSQNSPSYLLIDPEGVIVRTWMYGVREKTVWDEVEQTVKEAEEK